jgi:hypothetical protein
VMLKERLQSSTHRMAETTMGVVWAVRVFAPTTALGMSSLGTTGGFRTAISHSITTDIEQLNKRFFGVYKHR